MLALSLSFLAGAAVMAALMHVLPKRDDSIRRPDLWVTGRDVDRAP